MSRGRYDVAALMTGIVEPASRMGADDTSLRKLEAGMAAIKVSLYE